MTIAAIPQTIESSRTFGLSLKRLDGFAFKIEFDDDGLAPIETDEPEPLGSNRGPAPSRLLAAAIGNCLASSLVHCLGKARVPLEDLGVRVEATITRNAARRLRIDHVHVMLDPRVAEADKARLSRCVELFEDFCIVTESVRNGIDVSVSVATE